MVIAANVNKMASTKIKICIFHIVYLIFFILSKFLSFDFRLELDNTEREKSSIISVVGKTTIGIMEPILL